MQASDGLLIDSSRPREKYSILRRYRMFVQVLPKVRDTQY